MSVINQMLRDLDERQGRAQTTTPMTPVYKKKDWRPSLGMIVAAVVVIVAVLVLYPAPALDMFKMEKTVQPVHTEEEIVADTSQDLTAPKEEVETVIADADASDSQPVEQTPVVVNTAEGIEESILVEEQINQEVIAREPVIIKKTPARTTRQDAKAYYDDLVTNYGQPLTTSQLNEVLAIDPTFHQARIEMLTLLSQSNSTQFEQMAQASVDNWPDIHQYRQMLARSWVMDKPAAAYRLLTRQMPSIESAPDYHGLVAYSAQQMGDLTLAGKQYQLLLSSYPERADWWLALGLIEEQSGQTAQALRAFQQSLRFPGLSANIRAYAEQRVKAIQGY